MKKPVVRARAESERGINEHGAHGWRVAAPVEEKAFPLTRFEVPHGWEVGLAGRIINRHRGHEILGEIHGIVAAFAPCGPSVAIHPRELTLLPLERPPGEGDDKVAVNLPINERKPVDLVNLAENSVGVEARVLPDIDEKPQEPLHVGRVRRRGGDHVRRFVRLAAPGAGVADRTVVGHTREANDALGKADGQFPAFLPYKPKRPVTARSRHEIWEDSRQYDPNPIRNAAVGLCADRAIFEPLGLVGELLFGLFAEELVPGEPGDITAEDGQRNEEDEKFPFLSWGQTHKWVAPVSAAGAHAVTRRANRDLVAKRRVQNLFRYSTMASFSSGLRCVPYSGPSCP